MERDHRSLRSGKHTSAPVSVELIVREINDHHAILDSPETGSFKWPLSKLTPTPKIGETILLGLNNDKIQAPEKPSLEDLRALLEELVG